MQQLYDLFGVDAGGHLAFVAKLALVLSVIVFGAKLIYNWKAILSGSKGIGRLIIETFSHIVLIFSCACLTLAFVRILIRLTDRLLKDALDLIDRILPSETASESGG
ncbi:MAG: hypothetical protein KAY32_03285 [Candidatus Eisenbacteria sp.]|nr:hypothetical protein [Candidatus Eisenbacteria bacterium]